MPKQTKEHIDVWKQGLQNIKIKFSEYIPSIFKNTDYTAKLKAMINNLAN